MTPTDTDLDRLLYALANTARAVSPLNYLGVRGADNEPCRVACREAVREWLVTVQPESQR
jgi:hypothetical protein